MNQDDRPGVARGFAGQEGMEYPSCAEVLEQLWPYLDGELPEIDAEEVRMHLEYCQECSPRYDFQRAYLDVLKQQRQGLPPRRLRVRIFDQFLREERRPN